MDKEEHQLDPGNHLLSIREKSRRLVISSIILENADELSPSFTNKYRIFLFNLMQY